MNKKADRFLIAATIILAFENFCLVPAAKAHSVDVCIDILQEEAQIAVTGISKRDLKHKFKDEYKEIAKGCDHELEDAGLITLKQVQKDKAIANLVLSGQIAQDDLSPTKKKQQQDDLAQNEAKTQQLRAEICTNPAPEEEYACPKGTQETLTSQSPASNALTAQSTDPIIVGQWQGPFEWPLVAVHMAVGPNGKVLSWTRPKLSLGNPPQYSLWDPATNTFTNSPPFGQPGALLTDIFCGGQDFDPSGKLLIAGGHASNNNGDGSPDINTYDFITNTWKSYPNIMNAGRWYPTVTFNGKGEGVIVGGSISDPKTSNKIPQVWGAGSTQTLRTLSNAVLALPVYPYVWNFVAPSGRIFNSGPEKLTRALDTTGTGKWTTISSHAVNINRYYGTSVMYDDGKVLVVGGSNEKEGPPTKTAEVVELFKSNNWIPVFPMEFARRHHNATLLPDGKVLVTGGTSLGSFNNPDGSVLAAEIWDPQTTQWATVASMRKRRTYHSTAVLLPDGRVVLAGGGLPLVDDKTSDLNQGNYDAEIYSPPYLFKGARPVISSAPTNVKYGQTFTVQTQDAASISQVTWIRLSSTTHQFNAGQRINRLSFTPAPGGLVVTTSTNVNLAPPGYYMLFILNGNGVPSVAKIVQIS